MAISLGNAILWFKGDTSGIDKALKATVRSVGRGMDQAGKAVAGLGKAFTLIGAAITGVAAVSTKWAVDFDKGMREVNTMLNLTEPEFQRLSDQVRDLARRMGIDATGAAKALYQVISAGVPQENALDFLEVASKAAIAGVTDTTTAVDGLTTVLNAFGMEADQAGAVADVMFTTVKNGKTTFPELAASMSNVAPIAAKAGVSFETVSAAIATLTKQGTPTAEATTQIRAAIVALIAPNERMRDLFQENADQLIQQGLVSGETAEKYLQLKTDLETLAGQYDAGLISQDEYKAKQDELNASMQTAVGDFGQAIIQSQGLQGAFNYLTEATGGSTAALKPLIGRVEGVNAILQTTGANAQSFSNDIDAMTQAAGASDEAFQRMEESAARKYEHLKAQIVDLGLRIGNVLIPIISNLVTNYIEPLIQRLTDWMNAHPKLTQTIIVLTAAIGGIMVVVGPLLIGLGSLLSLFASLTVAFPALGAAILPVVAAVGSFAAAIAGIVGAAGVGWLIGRWIDRVTADTRFGRWIDGMMDKLVRFINKIKEWIGLKDKHPELGDATTGKEIGDGNIGTGSGMVPARAMTTSRAFSAIGGAAPRMAPVMAAAGAGPVSMTFNLSGTVREEADIDRIASAIGRKVESAMRRMGGR